MQEALVAAPARREVDKTLGHRHTVHFESHPQRARPGCGKIRQLGVDRDPAGSHLGCGHHAHLQHSPVLPRGCTRYVVNDDLGRPLARKAGAGLPARGLQVSEEIDATLGMC